jgi:hypothetical protein
LPFVVFFHIVVLVCHRGSDYVSQYGIVKALMPLE